MTSEQISRSIRTGTLQLSCGDKFSHYSPGIAGFFISSLTLGIWLTYPLIANKPSAIMPGDMAFWGFVVIPPVLGTYVLVLQKRRLRLVPIDQATTDSRQRITRLSKTLSNREGVFIAVTNPGFWSRSGVNG